MQTQHIYKDDLKNNQNCCRINLLLLSSLGHLLLRSLLCADSGSLSLGSCFLSDLLSLLLLLHLLGFGLDGLFYSLERSFGLALDIGLLFGGNKKVVTIEPKSLWGVPKKLPHYWSKKVLPEGN